MNKITYSEARANLAKTMDRVCDEHTPIVIARKNARPIVLISLDDYHDLDGTAYLLHNPVNARRLREAVAELRTGGGSERTLLE